MTSPFQKVGWCIYCDSTEPPLTREHVLPRGLGGNLAPNASSEAMVLLDATCEECREITRRFEDDCLNGMFGHARARLNMVRKDRVRPERKARVVYRDGGEEDRDIGKDYIPAAMVIGEFSTAAIFLGLDWKPGPTSVLQMVIGDEGRLRDPSIYQIAVQVNLNLKSFARMLSKIALGVAHYRLGPKVFEPIARSFIRNGKGHSNHFVGGYEGMEAPLAPASLHNASLWHHHGFLVVTIQLFAAANSPVNYAVVGRLRHMPPGLPPLPLGRPLQRQNRTPDPAPTSQPTTTIRWGQTFP